MFADGVAGAMSAYENGAKFEYKKETTSKSKDSEESTQVDMTSTNNILPSSEKVNNKNSVKDSEGKMLTEQQAEYFKNSKVRDADGNLLVVYHGTDDIPSIYVETIIEKQSKDDFLADLNKVRKEHAQSVNQNYSVTDSVLPSSEKVNNKNSVRDSEQSRH